MEKRKAWRWMVLVASMWLQGFAGVGYAFGSYSPILKARLRLDQTQMNILGVAKDLGDSVGLLAGIFSEILPPSALIFTGAVQNLVGYALIWLIAIAVIPPPPFIVVCIIMLVATNGESYFNTAALVSCVRTFPQNRGPIVGILKGYSGLTGAIITIFYAALFAPHQSFYIFLVALLPSAVAFIVMFIIEPIEHVKCKKQEEDRSFKFLYCVLLALAPYMMVVLLLQEFINMSRAVSIVFLLVFIMFQLAPLAIPLKIALSKQDDIINNKKKVSSIEEGLKTPLLSPEKITKELAKAVATDDAESSRIPAALVRPPSLVPHVSRFNPAPDTEPSQAPTLSRPPLLARSPSSQFPPPLPRSPSSQFIPALVKSPSSLLSPLPRSPSSQFTPSMIKSPSFQFVPPLLKSPSGQIMPPLSRSPSSQFPPLSRSPSSQFPPLSRSSSQWLNESFYFSEVEDERLAEESEALPEEVRKARAAELEARLYLAVAEGAIKIKSSRRGPRRGEDFTVGQALVKADFWLLFFALFSGAGSGLTVIDNLGQMAIAQGYSNAHIFVSLFSIWNFVGRLAGGYISEVIARDYVFPRGITVAASCLFLGVGHIVFAIAFPASLYMGTLFSGLGYGALWSIVPATASEIFGLKSFGALYNILCVANPAGSLIFSGIIAGCLYDREAKRQNGQHNLNLFTSLHFIRDSVQNPDEWVCSGAWCFRSTYIIMTGICVIGTMLSLVLTYRTRSVYLSLYGKKEPQKTSPNGAVSPTKDWFTNLKKEASLLPD